MQKPQISFGKFQNVDLRIGRVLSAPIIASSHPPVRKITVDLGELGQRTSVGQFALVPEDELIGANIVVCVNLAPREVAGSQSEVLVLGAHHPDSPIGEAQATPILASSSALAGSAVY